MSELTQAQIVQIRSTIAILESQRPVLGDAVVETAIVPLRAQLAALESPAPLPSIDERRLITILFAGIPTAAAQAEQLDPEEWRQIIGALYDRITPVIAKYQGTIAQYLADGFLALFGAHAYSEWDPENAVRAALDISSGLEIGNAQSPMPRPALGIGIHTGLVVTGEIGAGGYKEFTATGDAMNLAARLETAAPPGGVLISHDTYSHVRGVFDVTPCPPLSVKGKREPVQTYLVRRAKRRAFRMARRGVAGAQARTIGRERELLTLEQAYLDAFENRRAVWAQLVGEPGIGKTRLLEDCGDWIELRQETVRVLRARAFPGDLAQPFALIRRMWFDRFQIAEDAPRAEAEACWVQEFQRLGRTSEVEPAHALGLLLGLPFEDSPHIGAMRGDPTQVNGRAWVVSRELLTAMRQENMVEILLEDLQWADAASWEWLKQVVLANEVEPRGQGDRSGPTLPTGLNGLFILGTARPDWTPPAALSPTGAPDDYRLAGVDNKLPSAIPGQSLSSISISMIQLAPLPDSSTRELVRELLDAVENLPDDIVELIVERTEGVPYYAEELVNWLVDRGIINKSHLPWRFVPARLNESPLPATLQHLLLTRLNSLSTLERATLQRGAIFGRDFWTGGVQALGIPESAQTLESLQLRGLVRRQPESSLVGETEWSFQHALLREATYESVLKRERTAWHHAAARWWEAQAERAGRLDEFAGVIGEHAERAGDATAAANWYLRAGQRAAKQGAMQEARRFYSRVLSLTPATDVDRRWQALLGREEALGILGELDAARADIVFLLQIANAMQDDRRRAEVYHRQAEDRRRKGNYREGLEAAQLAVSAAHRVGDALVEAKALSIEAMLQTRLGEVAIGVATVEQALSLARKVGDPATLALVLYRAEFCYSESGDLGKSPQLLGEQIAIERRLGNRYQEAVGLSNLGVAYLNLGMYKSARPLLEQAVQITQALGARRQRAYTLWNLGESCWLCDDARSAKQFYQEALSQIIVAGDVYGEAGVLYELGLVLESSGDHAAAQQRFAEAHDLFMDAGALPLAHEVAAGLARCARAQGHLSEARRQADLVWTFLQDHGTAGMDYAMSVYQTCIEVFDALGEHADAAAAIEAGYRELMYKAAQISDPEWRKSFLENDRFNRALLELWQRRG
ncbi:MAG: adenylate/guanylate cyclase domain-containing protein [Anaerolineae bacterium]